MRHLKLVSTVNFQTDLFKLQHAHWYNTTICPLRPICNELDNVFCSGGLSLVSSQISCMGWVGEWDQKWTDSGSQRRLHKLTFDLTQYNGKRPWDMTWYVRYNKYTFIIRVQASRATYSFSTHNLQLQYMHKQLKGWVQNHAKWRFGWKKNCRKKSWILACGLRFVWETLLWSFFAGVLFVFEK